MAEFQKVVLKAGFDDKPIEIVKAWVKQNPLMEALVKVAKPIPKGKYGRRGFVDVDYIYFVRDGKILIKHNSFSSSLWNYGPEYYINHIAESLAFWTEKLEKAQDRWEVCCCERIVARENKILNEAKATFPDVVQDTEGELKVKPGE